MTRNALQIMVVLAASLSAATAANANLTVIATNCSGVLVIMHGMTQDQKALVLTTGHCIGFGGFMKKYPADGEVFVDRPVSGLVLAGNRRNWSARFRYDRLLFATMTGTDMALFELQDTYAEIQRDQPQVKVYTVARAHPTVGMKATVVSAFLDATYMCTVEMLVSKIREGPWTWTNFIRFEHTRDCLLRPGASGAPVIAAESGEVVALSQTGYEGGAACAIHNPCEVQPDGSTVTAPHVGHSYAAPTAWLYGCFAGGQFDFALPSCTYAKR